jgi:hypothetical protein
VPGVPLEPVALPLEAPEALPELRLASELPDMALLGFVPLPHPPQTEAAKRANPSAESRAGAPRAGRRLVVEKDMDT